jgi:hypothetical protein
MIVVRQAAGARAGSGLLSAVLQGGAAGDKSECEGEDDRLHEGLLFVGQESQSRLRATGYASVTTTGSGITDVTGA